MTSKPLQKKILPLNHQGAVLILTLLALVLLSLSGTTALFIAATDQKITGNFRKQAQAFGITEAGLEICLAQMRHDLLWRGNSPLGSPTKTSGKLTMGSGIGNYTVTITDRTDDNNGLFSDLIPPAHVKITSTGTVIDATQRLECYINFSPDPGSIAGSPYAAVVTQGDNPGNRPYPVNGYDDYGNLDATPIPNSMVYTSSTLPRVNKDALKAFADHCLTDLTDTLVGQSDFWKDAPLNTKPYIIHVSGDMIVSGSKHFYGIIFIEGEVRLKENVRVHGVIYAPNAVTPVEINSAGTHWDRPVMGQLIAGPGGVAGTGHDAAVQLVKSYVDTFNNYGGSKVHVEIAPGSWRQL